MAQGIDAPLSCMAVTRTIHLSPYVFTRSSCWTGGNALSSPRTYGRGREGAPTPFTAISLDATNNLNSSPADKAWRYRGFVAALRISALATSSVLVADWAPCGDSGFNKSCEASLSLTLLRMIIAVSAGASSPHPRRARAEARAAAGWEGRKRPHGFQ